MSTTYTTYYHLAKPSFDTRTWHDLVNGNMDILDAALKAIADVNNAVAGPASAVDGHVALFNGTTGKLIKDGGALGTAAFVNTSTLQLTSGANAYTGNQSASGYYISGLSTRIGTVSGSQANSTNLADCYVTSDGTDVTWILSANAPVGQTFMVVQGGAGQITFTAAVGATVGFSAGTHTKTARQYAVVTCLCIANSDGSHAVWIVAGSTA